MNVSVDVHVGPDEVVPLRACQWKGDGKIYLCVALGREEGHWKAALKPSPAFEKKKKDVASHSWPRIYKRERGVSGRIVSVDHHGGMYIGPSPGTTIGDDVVNVP